MCAVIVTGAIVVKTHPRSWGQGCLLRFSVTSTVVVSATRPKIFSLGLEFLRLRKYCPLVRTGNQVFFCDKRFRRVILHSCRNFSVSHGDECSTHLCTLCPFPSVGVKNYPIRKGLRTDSLRGIQERDDYPEKGVIGKVGSNRRPESMKCKRTNRFLTPEGNEVVTVILFTTPSPLRFKETLRLQKK